MQKQKIFAHKDIIFNDSLPGVKRDLLHSMISTNFPGREEFFSFYSKHNGGHFDKGAFFTERIFTL